MSQPQPYSRAFSFTNFQAQNPALTLPGSSLDLELNNAKATLDQILANMALMQRDDGAIANDSVGLDQLTPEVTIGFNAPVVWTTATLFPAGSSTVFQGSGFYRALVTHTSGVFATDLAAGNWQLIVNLAAVPLVAASQIAVTPLGLLTTDAQTSLQALDTGKAPLSHTQVSSTISDSTAAGRALLTATDVAAQNTLLGTTTLGFQPGDIKETACPVLQSGWYYCDGSNKNRTTDVNLFDAITIQQSGVLTNGSAIATGLVDTSNMSPGMPASAAGGILPGGTVILSVDSATQVTFSANATGSGTTAIVFAPYGVGDGSTTFGLPNRVYVGVGRDNASGSAANVTQVSTTITTTSGSPTATVASATGLSVGLFVSHPKVPSGTTISAITGTTLTLSANALASVSGSAARFGAVVDAQTLGARGGAISHSHTIVTAELPPYTPAGSVAGSISGSVNLPYNGARGFAIGGTDVPYQRTAANANDAAAVSGTFAGSLTGTPQGGTSTPFRVKTTQPTIVMNYIIKR